MGKLIAGLVVVLILVGGGISAFIFWPSGGGTKISYKGGARAVTSYPTSVPYADRFEKDEVLVTNPPVNFESKVTELGFEVIERVRLDELTLHLYRVRIPEGSTVAKALKLLAERLPMLNVDASHHFETLPHDEGLGRKLVKRASN